MADAPKPPPASASAASHQARRAVEAEVRERAAEAAAAPPAVQGDLLPGLPAPRQGGRPKGAGNRTTREVVEFYLARFEDPLQGLLTDAGKSIDDWCKELGCTKAEAWGMRQRAREAALPYVRQKLPQAIQVEGVPVIPLVLGVTPGLAAKVAGDQVGHVIEIVPDQPVSEGDPA